MTDLTPIQREAVQIVKANAGLSLVWLAKRLGTSLGYANTVVAELVALDLVYRASGIGHAQAVWPTHT